ncbi:hypothetical protein VNO78_03659 [Psophocarpus tetragonolobus]|uniref:Uncharacterized protein n=1 Tax=Psophocarpus tetragonolobus TaxID=3891 RepID=A0AAN9T3H3_PSOTE
MSSGQRIPEGFSEHVQWEEPALSGHKVALGNSWAVPSHGRNDESGTLVGATRSMDASQHRSQLLELQDVGPNPELLEEVQQCGNIDHVFELPSALALQASATGSGCGQHGILCKVNHGVPVNGPARSRSLVLGAYKVYKGDDRDIVPKLPPHSNSYGALYDVPVVSVEKVVVPEEKSSRGNHGWVERNLMAIF